MTILPVQRSASNGCHRSDSAQEADSRPRDWLCRALIVLVFFAIVAPTLTWPEFYNAEESVNVATALELRRDGHWKMPTLAGVPREVKPPLTAWVTAASIRESTLRGISSADPNVSDVAYRSLEWDVRWPMLLSACIVLLCVFEIGCTLDGWLLGVASAGICGTNWLFLRYAGLAETDSMLSLWVAVANAFLVKAVIERKYAIGFVGGGIAIGLAIMSKGPLAILQTVAPVMVFVIWRGFENDRNTQPAEAGRPRKSGWMTFLVIGIVLMLAIGAWWYLWMGFTTPGLWSTWIHEVTRYKANDLKPSPWYRYFVSVFFLLPWILFLLAGIWMSIEDIFRRRPRDEVLAFFLLAIPFVVMTFFSERKERYLLPLVAAAALVGGRAVVEYVRLGTRNQWLARLVVVAHWCVVGGLALGVPIAGSMHSQLFADMRRSNGLPWFSPEMGTIVIIGIAIVLWYGLWTSRVRRGAMVVTSIALILLANTLYVFGNSTGPGGKNASRPLANLLRLERSDATIYCFHPSGQYAAVFSNAAELSLYLNKTVTWVSDPATIPSSSHPQVLYTVEGKRRPDPACPIGWKPLVRVERQGETWFTFERMTP